MNKLTEIEKLNILLKALTELDQERGWIDLGYLSSQEKDIKH